MNETYDIKLFNWT